jgi:hypothetical protein
MLPVVLFVTIDDVPALNTSPVVVAKFQAVPEPVSVISEAPRFSVRAFVFADAINPTVTAYPLVDRTPLVSVSVRVDPEASALCSDQAPPTPLKVIAPAITTLSVLIVLPVVVALNVIVPVAFHTVPATKVMEPLTASVPVLEKVTVPADTVMSKHVNAPVKVTP